MTLADLKKEKIIAMKNRDKEAVSGLNVVISKLMLLEKSGNGEITELDVIHTIQKSVKELIEERDAFLKAERMEVVASLNYQIEFVNKYLPKMLSEEEIRNIIVGLPSRDIPSVMRYFKEEYAGKCEMKLVSEVLRKI